MPCLHPGKILLHQYLEPNQLSQNRLARNIGVPPRRINEIVLGKRSITADTSVRLALYFGNDAAYWMHLQTTFDIERATANIQLETITRRPASHPANLPQDHEQTSMAGKKPAHTPEIKRKQRHSRRPGRRIMR